MRGEKADKKLWKLPHFSVESSNYPSGRMPMWRLRRAPISSVLWRRTRGDGHDDVAGGDMRAYVVEIHPSVIKIVVRNYDHHKLRGRVDLLDKLEVDTWRFRLPSSARSKLATAVLW
ncbi:hypothetical protein OROHE_016497 [Orobanche hederae]